MLSLEGLLGRYGGEGRAVYRLGPDLCVVQRRWGPDLYDGSPPDTFFQSSVDKDIFVCLQEDKIGILLRGTRVRHGLSATGDDKDCRFALRFFVRHGRRPFGHRRVGWLNEVRRFDLANPAWWDELEATVVQMRRWDRLAAGA